MAKTEAMSLEQAMTGVLAMLAAARDDELNPARKLEDRRKTEVILAGAGLTPTQISQILDKKANTVAKAIARARKGSALNGGDDD